MRFLADRMPTSIHAPQCHADTLQVWKPAIRQAWKPALRSRRTSLPDAIQNAIRTQQEVLAGNGGRGIEHTAVGFQGVLRELRIRRAGGHNHSSATARG